MSSTPSLSPLAKIEQKTLIDLISQGKRIDERSPSDYREIKIEAAILDKADGSAQVHLGKTRILVGVKVDVGEPFLDTPDSGVLTVNAELVPLASPTFEAGPPDENAIELARIVDRGIRESGVVDVKKLCIIPGKKVYIIFIDMFILDHDGNLIDAAAMAALTALLTTKIRKYKLEDETVTFTDKYEPLPIQNFPATITTVKIGSSLIIDPSIEEENVAETRLTVAVDKNDNICAMQKGGLGTWAVEEIQTAVSNAIAKSAEIRNKVKEAAKK
ncbi:exosome complex protein Rrp42 [[Eubacterium] cellulosolvens]